MATIDYDALAKQAGAISSQPATSPNAPIDYDALAKQAGATSSVSTAASPGVLSTVGNFAKGIGEGATESAGETVQSLPWIGKKILSPEAMQAEREYFKPGSPAEKYGQTTGDIAEPILEFVLGDEALKGLAISEKVGLASKIAKIAQDSPYIGKLLQHGVNAARMGTVGATEALAKGATPSQAAKTGVATGIGGEAVSAAIDAAPAAVKSTIKFLNPFRAPSQEAAADVIRTAAGAGAGEPLVQGSSTVVDDSLKTLAAQKQAAYQAADREVGFDLKATKDQLKADQYAVKQPENIANQKAIQTRIDESTKRVAEAETKLKAAEIDPKAADALNTAWQAGNQVKTVLGRNVTADGAAKVDGLINGFKNLRLNAKYGDRLAQFLGKGDVQAGKPLADEFMNQLLTAQKAGAHAVRMQQVYKWLGGIALGGTAAGEIVKHVVP